MSGQVRLVCINTGDVRTMPSAEIRSEGVRNYRAAKPGISLYWDAKAGEPQEERIKVPDVYFAPNGKKYGYGLLILDDLIVMRDDPTKKLPQSDDPAQGPPRRADGTPLFLTYHPVQMPAIERARDIEGRHLKPGWWSYGVKIIAGKQPTEQEITAACSARMQYGRDRIGEAIRKKTEGQAGLGGFHASYNEADRIWAEEMGAPLPDTYEAMQRLNATMSGTAGGPSAPQASQVVLTEETAQCPACRSAVHPMATKCRHCGEKPIEPIILVPVSESAQLVQA